MPVFQEVTPYFSDCRNTDMFLIGITGKAESGKDTTEGMLKSILIDCGVPPENIYSDSFARPLREAYVALFGDALGFTCYDIVKADFKRQINTLTGRTHRRELQLLGTEHYREGTCNFDIWVQNLALRTKGKLGVLIISDVRFTNEATFVADNGVIIEVVRPNHGFITEGDHASERGLGDAFVDHVLLNDGTKEQLKERVEEFVTRFLCMGGSLSREDLGNAFKQKESVELYKDSLYKFADTYDLVYLRG